MWFGIQGLLHPTPTLPACGAYHWSWQCPIQLSRFPAAPPLQNSFLGVLPCSPPPSETPAQSLSPLPPPPSQPSSSCPLLPSSPLPTLVEHLQLYIRTSVELPQGSAYSLQSLIHLSVAASTCTQHFRQMALFARWARSHPTPLYKRNYNRFCARSRPPLISPRKIF